MIDYSKLNLFMKNKSKGQITLFAIVGLVLLLGVMILFFVFRSESIGFGSEVDTSQIRIFSEECLEDVSYEAVILSGIQGGRLEVLENAINSEYSDVNLAYDSGSIVLASNDEIENELSNYISSAFDVCTESFDSFRNEYDIETGDKLVRVNLFENNVLVSMSYPITVSNGESQKSISEFSSKIDVRAGYVFDSVREFLDEYSLSPTLIDNTYLDELDLNATVLSYDESSFILSFEDYESRIKDENYVVMIGIKP